MSKVCSSHNLMVLDNILIDFRYAVFCLRLLSDADYHVNVNEWLRMLSSSVDMVEKIRNNLDLFEAALHDSVDVDLT